MYHFSYRIPGALMLILSPLVFVVAGCDSVQSSKPELDNELSFVSSAITAEEQEVLDRYRQADALVLEKRPYFDLSSPVEAYLSLRSALAVQDPEAYEKTVASEFTQEQILNIFANNPLESLRQVLLQRVPNWPKEPGKGHLHPLYITHGGEKAVAVFVFDGMSWRFLDVIGGGLAWPAWRQHAEKRVKESL